MQIRIQVHKCGFRSGGCLFSNDLVADKAKPCGSIALKGSSSLMGFLCDANVERQPLPLVYSDMLSHRRSLDAHSFSALHGDAEQTREHVVPSQTHSCDTPKTPCPLIKRQGSHTMGHNKQLCNCFWETALVAGCHRLAVYSVCRRRPRQQRSLLNPPWDHFINSIQFDASL